MIIYNWSYIWQAEESSNIDMDTMISAKKGLKRLQSFQESVLYVLGELYGVEKNNAFSLRMSI